MKRGEAAYVRRLQVEADLSTGDGAARCDSKSSRTRARIVAAAAEVLETRGYAGTRLRDIAAAAEVQAPAIYYYFASREDLIEEVVQLGLRRASDHLTATLAEMPATATSLERILAAVAAHLEVTLSVSQFASASMRNFSQLPQPMRDRSIALRRQYGKTWKRLFDDAAADGMLDPNLDVLAVRMFVIGALNSTIEWWNPEKQSAQRMVANAQQFVHNALVQHRP